MTPTRSFSVAFGLTIAALLMGSLPGRAENLVHVQRLMTQRQCQGCDLSEAGLVHSNLERVDLTNADLSMANLNQADLRGANLSGANLSYAVLVNVDLTGANLRGANLTGANLQEAYLTGANLDGAILDGANLQGAVGLPDAFMTVENLYQWGLVETQRGNFRGAIDYFNRALNRDPNYVHAILARGVSRHRLGDFDGALADAARANELFALANNAAGQEAANRLTMLVNAYIAVNNQEVDEGEPNFLNFVSSLSTLLLRYLLR